MQIGIDRALLVAGIAMIVSPLAAIFLRVPEVESVSEDIARTVADPEVRLALTPRSGPFVGAAAGRPLTSQSTTRALEGRCTPFDATARSRSGPIC